MGGRLNAAITRLLQAIDPSYAPPAAAGAPAGGASSPRLEALELLTAILQVGQPTAAFWTEQAS